MQKFQNFTAQSVTILVSLFEKSSHRMVEVHDADQFQETLIHCTLTLDVTRVSRRIELDAAFFDVSSFLSKVFPL